MDALFTAVIALPAGFVCGVIFHKYVISEAASIKAHVSAEIAILKEQLDFLKKI